MNESQPARPVRVVGAYAAQPEEPAERQAFLEGVLALPGVDGLELPWGEPSWAEDVALVRDVLPTGGRHVLTLVRAEGARNAQDPAFGLASPDDAGRARAVDLLRAARDTVAALTDAGLGVVAVEAHTWPSLDPAEGADAGTALGRSLAEVLQWDWSGATVVIEHCDARTSRRPWRKGLLALDLEARAVAAARGGPTDVGMAVNWGRSAIEERDPGAPERHARTLRAAGLLTGVIFSGATAGPGSYGDPWSDVHPPLRDDVPESVLDADAVAAVLAAAGDGLVYDGVKVAARPPHTSVRQRLDLIQRVLTAMDR
ncbi:DUF4862 family protein [Georgenia sp. TF02-10]|uniref:DUF4862 family protein n=1 Tax=Georgenia sp. TF02-10 TaxID=2917725 RepID=UPI001FA7046B|nr:DUF4862 family protein [Georgenia sp. TF02-10]UNX55122.1 DUF4862 family protein [Georgenia sp. TF02-10]